MTLTAAEAVECSLAADIVTGPADFQSKLGLADMNDGEDFLQAAAREPEREEGSPEAFFQELHEKRLALGFGSEMTTLHEEKATAQWESYLESVGRGRPVSWSVAILDIKGRDDEKAQAELELTRLAQQIRQASSQLRAATTARSVRAWQQKVDELKKQEIEARRALAMTQDNPFMTLSIVGNGSDCGLILAYVSRKARGLMENAKPGDTILLRGDIDEVLHLPVYGEMFYVVGLGECTAEAP